MSDRPYTDNDLQIEAAREIKYALDNIDTDGLLEASTYTLPDGGRWEQLREADWVHALRRVDDLIETAADTSVWAVSLGVDGLEPVADVIEFPSATLDASFARMHFAFHPDVPADTRTHVINRIRTILAANL